MTGVYCHIDYLGAERVRVRVTELKEEIGVDEKGREYVVSRTNGDEVARFEMSTRGKRGSALRQFVEGKVATMPEPKAVTLELKVKK